MNDLQAVSARLNGLIGNLSASARKEMARAIAGKLRASQQQNIRRQQAPDGTPFKPRKVQPVRSKKGRVRREMFAKLRTAKYMKAKSTSEEAVIEFTGSVKRIASVHHYGLRDRLPSSKKDIKYEERPLLGVNNSDLEMIRVTIIDALYK